MFGKRTCVACACVYPCCCKEKSSTAASELNVAPPPGLLAWCALGLLSRKLFSNLYQARRLLAAVTLGAVAAGGGSDAGALAGPSRARRARGRRRAWRGQRGAVDTPRARRGVGDAVSCAGLSSAETFICGVWDWALLVLVGKGCRVSVAGLQEARCRADLPEGGGRRG